MRQMKIPGIKDRKKLKKLASVILDNQTEEKFKVYCLERHKDLRLYKYKYAYVVFRVCVNQKGNKFRVPLKIDFKHDSEWFLGMENLKPLDKIYWQRVETYL